MITGKPICNPMKWSKGEHILDVVERAQFCSDQESDTVCLKDIFCPKLAQKCIVDHLNFSLSDFRFLIRNYIVPFSTFPLDSPLFLYSTTFCAS